MWAYLEGWLFRTWIWRWGSKAELLTRCFWSHLHKTAKLYVLDHHSPLLLALDSCRPVVSFVAITKVILIILTSIQPTLLLSQISVPKKNLSSSHLWLKAFSEVKLQMLVLESNTYSLGVKLCTVICIVLFFCEPLGFLRTVLLSLYPISPAMVL